MKKTLTEINKTTINWFRFEETNFWVSEKGIVELRESGHRKVLSQHRRGAGYLQVILKKRYIYVHRLLMCAKAGMKLSTLNASKLQVNHINGKRWDNRLENLELVSASSNILHAVESGLVKPKINISDANNKKVFYTDEQVEKMRELYQQGYSQVSIAKLFGTIQPTVSRIVRGVYRSAV